MKMRFPMKFFIALLLMATSAAFAGEVRILEVRVECPNSCTFAVTLEHEDEGWHHYANQWDVMTLEGNLLKSRVLHHPHVNEQPFTRSLSGVLIAPEIKQVKIRARDSQHGYSSNEVIVDLPQRD